MLTIQTLDELNMQRDGEALPLPASEKTRALLGYLLMTMRPHCRDRHLLLGREHALQNFIDAVRRFIK